MIAVVPKIGTGTEDDPYRPDTDAQRWYVLGETADEFIIEIME